MRRGNLVRAGRVARCAVALTGAAVLLILTATVVSADCGDTAAAVVQGQWQVDGTTTYTGNVPATLP